MADFNPSTAKYSPCNAFGFGKAADLAYADPSTIESMVAQWGFPRVRVLDRENTQAFVAGNDQMVMVAFRGTEPKQLQDWMTDAKVELVDGPFGKVHLGFWRALNYVWEDLTRAVGEFQDQGQSLWFTGHSLGAAVATLAVARLRAPPSDKPVYGLYTFGQPRTGDRDFAQNFDADFKTRTFRFVNNDDIVTRVPLRLTGYSHVGTFLYFDSAGKLSDDLGFWYSFVDSVKGGIQDLGKMQAAALADHSMTDGYLPKLDSNKGMNPF